MKGTTFSIGEDRDHLYALFTHQDSEDSPDVVMSMLQIFSHDVYVLLSPGSTLSYVTPYVAVNFNLGHDSISEPFSVYTPIGESIIAKRIYKNYVIYFSSGYCGGSSIT